MSAPAPVRSVPRRRSTRPRLAGGRDPRRRGPRDRHERRRPGAPLLARHPDRPPRYDVSVVVAVGGECRPQAPAGRHRASWSSTSRTTRSRSARWPRTSPRSAPTSSTPTCTAPRPSARARSIALGEAGQRRPYLVATVHSSRIRSEEDRRALRELTPADRPAHRGLAGDRAQARSTRAATIVPVRLIYNGVDLQRYDHQEPCCTLPEEYGMEPGLADRRRRRPARAREGPPDAARGLAGRPARRPGRLSPDRRRGQPPRRARGAGARAADRPPGRLHRPPRRRPGRDRRARRRRAAVLSRGAGPDDPRGDGAVAPGRRVERRRHPRDDRGRRHRACSSRRTTPRRSPPRSSGC